MNAAGVGQDFLHDLTYAPFLGKNHYSSHDEYDIGRKLCPSGRKRELACQTEPAFVWLEFAVCDDDGARCGSADTKFPRPAVDSSRLSTAASVPESG